MSGAHKGQAKERLPACNGNTAHLRVGKDGFAKYPAHDCSKDLFLPTAHKEAVE
jgi:hypothetical protein